MLLLSYIIHSLLLSKVFNAVIGVSFDLFKISFLNQLSANITKWSNTRKLPTNCFSVFDYFVRLVLKGLR